MLIEIIFTGILFYFYYNAICYRSMTLSCFTYRFRAHSLFIYVCYISVAAEDNLQKHMQGQSFNYLDHSNIVKFHQTNN